MEKSALGFMLQKLREDRQLSLRETAQIAEIDHAYIYRLETGAKEAPSELVLSKLIKALKAGKREADILRYLAEHLETSSDLVELALKDPTIDYDLFASVAGASFRGSVRPDYAKLVERFRRILAEEAGGGGT